MGRHFLFRDELGSPAGVPRFLKGRGASCPPRRSQFRFSPSIRNLMSKPRASSALFRRSQLKESYLSLFLIAREESLPSLRVGSGFRT